MKILSAEQVRLADAYTIAHEPVKSIDLMERAAEACVKWIVAHLDDENEFLVFCGPGNNGGDGLAIARMLSEKGRAVEVFLVDPLNKLSPDCSVNKKRLEKIKKIKLTRIDSETENWRLKTGNSKQVIIDALFGTGINKPIEGLTADVIEEINQSKLPVISIDVPSGLFCDKTSVDKNEHIIRATYTLTFELPKLGFMFHENASKTGDWHILPIRLDKKFISETETKNHFVDRELVRTIFRKRKKFSHKGTYGHALIIAGSKDKMGAAVLSAHACLRSGVGLLTMHIPVCGMDAMNISLPEAMTEADEDDSFFSGVKNIEKYDAIGIGPGIGTEPETVSALKVLIQNSVNPLVFDADALNILSENKTWLSFLPPGSILTPHVREFERLAGKSSDDFERHQMQVNFAVKYRVHVILKGAHTCIVSPGGISYFNSTGNPGMARGGSGDSLTGILTSLLAQGYDPFETCILGVYLHGLAGDIAADKLSQEAMISGDIAEYFSEAFKQIQGA